ncbi:hypothetical protein GCM10022217_20560 [Chryseobacterium ginsenosidimutans]|uniref:DUF6705 family protein n=1 Tax=Chryseobacterium ginsenosidimutans TaxID=687846 RepID=UPI0031E22495
MKYLILLTLLSIVAKSQTIIDIRDNSYSNPNNTYYDYYKKDLNNLLDPFQGTYIYTNGNISFKIVLQKMIKQSQSLHFEDLIIGEYQYIENGIEKTNTISNINIIYNNQYSKHAIAGNSIINNNNREWKCPQCNANEKRLRAKIIDRSTDRHATIFMRRTTVNGQEVLQVKVTDILPDYGTTNPQAFSLPFGEFTMIKQ